MQTTTIDNVIEEQFRKIENEELLRIFPINTVVGTGLGKSSKNSKHF